MYYEENGDGIGAKGSLADQTRRAARNTSSPCNPSYPDFSNNLQEIKPSAERGLRHGRGDFNFLMDVNHARHTAATSQSKLLLVE